MAVFNSRHPQEIAIAIYKLANCWHYNSCDHKYNEQDFVWQEIEKIKEIAIAISGLILDNLKIKSLKIIHIKLFEEFNNSIFRF